MIMIINVNSKIAVALIAPIMMMIHDADESCYNAQLTVTVSNLWTTLWTAALQFLTSAKGSQGVESIFGYYLE